MKTELTDNELIAEFIGAVESRDSGICGIRTYWINNNDRNPTETRDMHYGNSWDWLMPVVQKINSLFDAGCMEGFDIDILRSMQDWIISVNIKNACADAVTIIKWYKENKKFNR